MSGIPALDDLEESFAYSFEPVHPRKSVPAGLSHFSTTLSPCSQEAFFHEDPFFKMYQSLRDLEVCQQEQNEEDLRLLQEDDKELERLTCKEEKALREQTEAISKQQSWGTLATVAQYLTASTSLVLGIGCIASGAVLPGTLLIVSSAISFMHTFGAWEAIASKISDEEETRVKITYYMEISALILSVGLTLFGGFLAHSAGTLSHMQQAFSMILSVAQGAINLVDAFYQRRIAHAHAELTGIRAETTEVRNRTFNYIDRMQDRTQALTSTGEQVRGMIR